MYSKSQSGAIFSICDQHRFSLWRKWSAGKRMILFIMLNPSTADAERNDPTIARCIQFAKDWRFDGLFVGNLFSLRSTHPKLLYEHPTPVVDLNNYFIDLMAELSSEVIFAWGNYGALKNQGTLMLHKFIDGLVLEVNKSGNPKHPLYIKKTAEPRKLNVSDLI